jgi:hypothetical protein
VKKKPIKLIKILKKPIGSIQFYKPETEKPKLNPNRKKPEKNRTKSEKNRAKPKKPSQIEKTEPKRFEPVFVLKNRTKTCRFEPVSVWFGFF